MGQDTILSAAVKYYSLGLAVMPINANKEAILKRWTSTRFEPNGNFKQAHGIGLVCGKLSGGVEVVDVDCKYDLTGRLYENYTQDIERVAPGLFSRLLIQKTRSSGYHLIYRCSTIEGNQKLAQRPATEAEKKDKEKIKVLLETRGEGGYICIAPTPGYSFMQGDLSNIPEITTDEREILLSIARRFQQVYKKPYEQGYSGGGKSPFQDYNDRGKPVELLVSHGWQVVITKGSDTYLKRPGTTESKWSADYNTEMKCLYVFSTSTEFDAEKAYNPATIFCKLEAGDDWKKCCQLLLEKGYGEHPRNSTSIVKQPEQSLTAEEIFTKYERYRIGADKPVAQPAPAYKIHGIPIGTPGSISAIFGGPKAGKTAIGGTVISCYIKSANGADIPV